MPMSAAEKAIAAGLGWNDILDGATYGIANAEDGRKVRTAIYAEGLLAQKVTTEAAESAANAAVAKEAADEAKAAAAEAKNAYSAVKAEYHGLKELALAWKDGYLYGYGNQGVSVANHCTTEFFLLPESGIHVVSRRIETDEKQAAFRAFFWRYDEDGSIVPADDYECYFDGSTAYHRQSAFFPYAEDVYCCINVNLGTDGDNKNNHGRKEAVHVYYGEVSGNGGRLPNMMTTPTIGYVTNNSYDPADHYLKFRGSTLSSISASRYGYVSILPLREVSRIVCSAGYEMCASVIVLDRDEKTASKAEDIFDTVLYAGRGTTLSEVLGLNVIDVSDYQCDGYIYLNVRKHTTNYLTSSGTFWVKSTPNGMQRDYDDIINNVFVEWAPGVIVSVDGGIPAVARENINIMQRTVMAPNMMEAPEDGGWGNFAITLSRDPQGAPSGSSGTTNNELIYYPAFGETCGWLYNGSSMYNTPYMHISRRSYLTASKNHHSRIYMPWRHGAETANYGYGSVCGTNAALVCGMATGNETMNYCSELVPNCEYRDFDGIDSIRPGDLIAVGTFTDEKGDLGNDKYGHVTYCTERIVINGKTFCVNVLEAGSMIMRYRTYVNQDAEAGYTASDDASWTFDNGWSSRYWDNYKYRKLARLNRNAYRTIRDAYGAVGDADYDVGTVMLDRGDQAVYCTDDEMWLFVTDGSTTVYFTDGSTSEKIELSKSSDRRTYEGEGSLYLVSSIEAVRNLDGGKFWTVLHSDETTEETGFYKPLTGRKLYVPRDDEGNVVTDDDGNVNITFDADEEDDYVVAVEGAYKNDTYTANRPVFYYDFEDGSAAIPGSVTLCDGIKRTISYVRILRRTQYGTYWVKNAYSGDKAVSVTQAAGGNV